MSYLEVGLFKSRAWISISGENVATGNRQVAPPQIHQSGCPIKALCLLRTCEGRVTKISWHHEAGDEMCQCVLKRTPLEALAGLNLHHHYLLPCDAERLKVWASRNRAVCGFHTLGRRGWPH